jgi:hypothetical protein
MKRLLSLVLCVSLVSACASLPLKQKAVTSLQASEVALEAAHDLERGLCFISPATESGGHCTSPVAASVGLTDERHQQLAALFAKAFEVEIKAATVLQAWQSGDPAPASIAEYQADITAILNVARQLLASTNAQHVIDKAQQAVDAAAVVAAVLGVK